MATLFEALQESESNGALCEVFFCMHVTQRDRLIIHPNPALLIHRAHVAVVTDLWSLDSAPLPEKPYLHVTGDICKCKKEIGQ